MRRRRCFETLTAALLALLMIGHGSALAQGKKPPKDDGGGEDPPPVTNPTPIEYQVTNISLPPLADPNSYFDINELSDSGVAVGFYNTDSGEQRGWLYDPFIDASAAIDLNMLPIDGLNLNEWTIASAVGVNNNGLVVGYVRHKLDPTYRRGFVLDVLLMQVYLLPDELLSDTYARKVNDNGDILGRFRGNDGLIYAYLYNPGLRSGVADPGFEFLGIAVVEGPIGVNLNNPGVGMPSQIVGAVSGSNKLFKYTRKGILEVRDFLVDRPAINDFGDIAGVGYETIPLRGNKTTTEYFLWRERQETGILEELVRNVEGINCRDLNNFGTILSGGYLYHNEYGYVDISALMSNGTQAPEYYWEMNSVGPLGFGEIVGTNNDGPAELFILTPVQIQP